MADTRDGYWARNSADFNKGQIAVRQYRHTEDLAAIRQSFQDATMGLNSPYTEGIRTYFAPGIRVVHLGLIWAACLVLPSHWWSVARNYMVVVHRLGLLLLATSCIGMINMWVQRQKVQRAFHELVDESLAGDLADIVNSFGLRVTEGGVCVATGPCGFWVAEEAGNVIGFVGLRLKPYNALGPDWLVGDVRRLAVSRGHQRKGVARKLMNTLVSYAREHKLKALELMTSDYNTCALQFYTKIGWKLVGRTDYHGISLAVMRQDLE